MPDEPADAAAAITRLAADAVRGAVLRDAQIIAHACITTTKRYGPDGLYLLCRAISEIGRKAAGIRDLTSDEYAAVIAADTRTGQPVENPDTLPADYTTVLWAARFWVAHLNDDDATCEALFIAAAEADEPMPAYLTALLLRTLDPGAAHVP